jgi:glycerophosphoryl diester phosphodiesterase
MQVIGHRGAAALAPENTWASFDVALDIGVDALETDVRATSDGVLVLLHDEHLDRTTNGQGLTVHTTPWSVVKTSHSKAVRMN